jgi:hypothetical protein
MFAGKDRIPADPPSGAEADPEGGFAMGVEQSMAWSSSSAIANWWSMDQAGLLESSGMRIA